MVQLQLNGCLRINLYFSQENTFNDQRVHWFYNLLSVNERKINRLEGQAN